MSEFLEELRCWATLAGEVLLVARADVGADLWIPNLEVVLELVDVHEANDRDAVLFEDEVLLVEADSFDYGAQIHSGLCQGESLNHDGFGLLRHLRGRLLAHVSEHYKRN